jgi:hypothetical protein
MALNTTILCYFKIPFTEETATFKAPLCMTITQFIHLVEEVLREIFDIHERYVIEIVEINFDKGEYGPALLPNNSQTLEQRYGNMTQPISFYLRPVNAETGLFVRQTDYRL